MKFNRGIQFFAAEGTTITMVCGDSTESIETFYAYLWTDGTKVYRNSTGTISSSDGVFYTPSVAITGLSYEYGGTTYSVGLNELLDIDKGAPRDSLTVYCLTSTATKTTFDLSTLDLADGTHSVTVKAKASGYKPSEASNAVSYTVSSSTGYYITFANVAYDNAISEHVFIQLNGEGDWIDLDNDGSL